MDQSKMAFKYFRLKYSPGIKLHVKKSVQVMSSALLLFVSSYRQQN